MQSLQRFVAVLVLGLVYFGLMKAKTLAADNPTLVYIGTYTGGKSKGIYCTRFDATTGKLTPPELAATTKNPSFLALHPNRRFLYSVGELSGAKGLRAGAVNAYSIEPGTGKLTLLNRQPSGGQGPCHVSVDPTGASVLVANYGNGSIAALPVQPDGSLKRPAISIQHHGSGLNPVRQEGPHAHFIIPDPNNRFALTCDLGIDQVLVYRFAPGPCELSANQPPGVSVQPGSGPRHLVFHPGGRWVYMMTELSASVTAFTYDPDQGALKAFQTISALPADFKGTKSGAEIQIHPSGRFLYASNRGHDSIVVFAIDPATGQLTYVEHQASQGKIPRHFLLDPSGKWMLVENQDSDNVVVFKVSASTGRLTPTAEQITVGSPVCAVFARAD